MHAPTYTHTHYAQTRLALALTRSHLALALTRSGLALARTHTIHALTQWHAIRSLVPTSHSYTRTYCHPLTFKQPSPNPIHYTGLVLYSTLYQHVLYQRILYKRISYQNSYNGLSSVDRALTYSLTYLMLLDRPTTHYSTLFYRIPTPQISLFDQFQFKDLSIKIINN